MADYAVIERLVYQHYYAHDGRDPEALAACFARDANYLGASGRENVVRAYQEGWAGLKYRRRHIVNNFILAEDGDTEALAQYYLTLYLIKDDEVHLHLTGMYRERVVLEDGEWKLLGREVTRDVPYDPGDVDLSTLARP